MKTRIPLLLVFNGAIITALWIHCTPSQDLAQDIYGKAH